jgi:hypothetical protein
MSLRGGKEDLEQLAISNWQQLAISNWQQLAISD